MSKPPLILNIWVDASRSRYKSTVSYLICDSYNTLMLKCCEEVRSNDINHSEIFAIAKSLLTIYLHSGSQFTEITFFTDSKTAIKSCISGVSNSSTLHSIVEDYKFIEHQFLFKPRFVWIKSKDNISHELAYNSRKRIQYRRGVEENKIVLKEYKVMDKIWEKSLNLLNP